MAKRHDALASCRYRRRRVADKVTTTNCRRLSRFKESFPAYGVRVPDHQVDYLLRTSVPYLQAPILEHCPRVAQRPMQEQGTDSVLRAS